MKIHNQSGQILIESVLIMFLGVGLFISMTSLLKKSDVINQIVSAPWKKTSAMIETGTWSNSAAEGKKKHPNTGYRGRTLDPK